MDEILQFNANADELRYVPPPQGDSQLPPLTDTDSEAEPEAEPESESGESESTTESFSGFSSRQLARIRSAADYAGSRARVAYDRVAAAPTPGGSSAILTAIILILFAAVPVSKQGKTRLALLWDTVGGKTFLENRVSPTGLQSSSTPGQYSDQSAAQVSFRGRSVEIYDLSDL